MTAEVRGKIRDAMLVNDKSLDKKKHNDVRVRDTINESLNVGPNGSWADFTDLFVSELRELVYLTPNLLTCE